MVSALQRPEVQLRDALEGLNEFVAQWLQDYKRAVDAIDLFKPELSKNLSREQQAFFAKAFYHARGHCNDFFWFVANHGTYEMKQLIIDNTVEEYGGNQGKSHELLYYEFASAVGVDLTDEVVNETTHLPFMHDYNRGHLRWLAAQDAGSLMAAFAAYEKLDNPDYTNLYELVKSFDVEGWGLVFFDVHRHVEHYEATTHVLANVWVTNPEKVKEAFTFIGEHQIVMWEKLSDAVFSYSSQPELQTA